MEQYLDQISRIIWGWPLIVSIIFIGIYFTCGLKILKFSRLKLSVESIFKKEKCDGDISVFASLCTALSATIGTGSIVGMAVAITTGGPGALFWLWVSSVFSLAIKYAEGLLSIKYRAVGNDGKVSGGPMYYIGLGLNGRWFAKPLAGMFSFFGMMTALVATGTLAQSNSITVAMRSFGVPIVLAAAFVTICTAAIILGGIKRISKASEWLIPLATILYIMSSILILILNHAMIPDMFRLIFREAFSPGSIIGGGAGLTIGHVISIGVCRGVFCHESGLGSSAIAHSAGMTTSPCRQGLASMSGAIASIIVCTMTCLVLIITHRETGIFCQDRVLDGLQFTTSAFGLGLGIEALGKYIIGIGIVFFAFTTIIGWNYYGEKCAQHLFGNKSAIPYQVLFMFFVAIGPFYDVKTIFVIADIATGLMAITNLIGVVSLRKVVIEETRKFFAKS
jgi:AGCS family alanine or glycine:cation symporter